MSSAPEELADYLGLVVFYSEATLAAIAAAPGIQRFQNSWTPGRAGDHDALGWKDV